MIPILHMKKSILNSYPLTLTLFLLLNSISLLSSRTTLLPLPTSGVPGGGGVFPMQAELVPGALYPVVQMGGCQTRAA